MTTEWLYIKEWNAGFVKEERQGNKEQAELIVFEREKGNDAVGSFWIYKAIDFTINVFAFAFYMLTPCHTAHATSETVCYIYGTTNQNMPRQ